VNVKKTGQGSQVVFVKDTWWSGVEGVELDGDILHNLNKKGVMNIPLLIAHRDAEVGSKPNANNPTPLFLRLA